MTDPDLIGQAITASSLSARRFAERVLVRDERTVRRWVSGQLAIPAVVSVRLSWLLALPASRRAALIALLDRD